jgi:hypothetical protein
MKRKKSFFTFAMRYMTRHSDIEILDLSEISVGKKLCIKICRFDSSERKPSIIGFSDKCPP